jgi:hypothetical protein
MFDKKYEDRLRAWNEFRQSLEESDTPLEDTVKFYERAPVVSIQVDPWEPDTWLNPWELLYENQYCEFSKILAICYSLQLTDCFMTEDFEIHICTNDKEASTCYLLFFQNRVVGYEWSKIIDKNDLPMDLQSQQHYLMPRLQ